MLKYCWLDSCKWTNSSCWNGILDFLWMWRKRLDWYSPSLLLKLDDYAVMMTRCAGIQNAHLGLESIRS